MSHLCIQHAINVLHDSLVCLHCLWLLQQRQGNLGGAGSSLWPRAAPGVRVDGMFDGRMRFGNGFGDETTFSVPAEKCGLVIGKGVCCAGHLQLLMIYLSAYRQQIHF